MLFEFEYPNIIFNKLYFNYRLDLLISTTSYTSPPANAASPCKFECIHLVQSFLQLLKNIDSKFRSFDDFHPGMSVKYLSTEVV